MYTIEEQDGVFAAIYDERDALIICEALSSREAEALLIEEMTSQGTAY